MVENISSPTIDAVVSQSVRITSSSQEEVRRITLAVDDPSFRYLAGQNVAVVVPGPHPFGNQEHSRRYTIYSDEGVADQGTARFSILVRRCFYIDEVNGEKYPGIASNFLCDAKPGKRIALSGPFKNPFQMPADSSANILMVGAGTGMAPFRTMIKQIYRDKGAWHGDVRLFFGSKTGMELAYLNDKEQDVTNYYDEETFKAYQGLVDRPLTQDADGLAETIETHCEEIRSLLEQPNTYIYLAGLTKVAQVFEQQMSEALGGNESWQGVKQRLLKEGRLFELLYS